jgi:hypothetical protein
LQHLDDALSQELPKLRFSQPGVAHDSAHCEGIHGVVAWNRHDAFTVSHDDMLSALTRDAKAHPFERTYSTPMRYACDARHDSSNRNVDFSTLATAKLLVNDGKVLADRVGNVGQCLFLRRSLRPAAWKTRNRYCDAFVTSFQSHAISHETRILLPAFVVERRSSLARAFARAQWSIMFGFSLDTPLFGHQRLARYRGWRRRLGGSGLDFVTK